MQSDAPDVQFIPHGVPAVGAWAHAARDAENRLSPPALIRRAITFL